MLVTGPLNGMLATHSMHQRKSTKPNYLPSITVENTILNQTSISLPHHINTVVIIIHILSTHAYPLVGLLEYSPGGRWLMARHPRPLRQRLPHSQSTTLLFF